MKTFFTIGVFGLLFCASFAIIYSPDGFEFVKKELGINVTKAQDTTKILSFLHAYLCYRSLDGGWRTPIDFPNLTTGLYYVSTVKLTDRGDATSYIKKKGEVVVEYLIHNGDSVILQDRRRIRSVAGVVYHVTSTLSSTHSDSLRISLNGLLSEGLIKDYVKAEVVSVLCRNGDVQVATSIVRGFYCGNDMGEYLISAVYLE